MVFGTLGGFFCVAFLAAVLFCVVKKKMKRVMVPDEDCGNENEVDDRVVIGPCGEQTVMVSSDDDDGRTPECEPVRGPTGEPGAGQASSSAPTDHPWA